MGRPEARVNAETLTRMPVHVSEDYQMRAGDFIVIAESASAAVVVTLPSLAEAIPGMNYTVVAPAGATNDVSVNEKETGAEFTTYGDLDAAGDYLIVTPAGDKWALVGSLLG